MLKPKIKARLLHHLGAYTVYEAAKRGDSECLKIVLGEAAHGSGVQLDDLHEALMDASKNGRSECVKLLLGAGADVNHVGQLCVKIRRVFWFFRFRFRLKLLLQ